MITPAYSITATERVLPRLALDFTTGVLDSRVTVTRALNTATRINSSGYIESVNANLPRFDYDPVTLLPKGLLIEESRANLLLQSENFKTSWTNDDNTINDNAGTAPNGSNSFQSLIPNTNNVAHRVRQSFTAVNSPTATVYMQSAGHTHGFVALYWADAGLYSTAIFDLVNGQYTGYTGLQPSATSILPTKISGVWRVSTRYNQNIVVCAIGSANNGTWSSVAQGIPAFSGNDVDGIKIWGAQLEAGAFATSYIPTTTTSLTRNADAVSMTGTNFSDWYNATEGTLSFEGSVFVDQGATTVDFVQISNGVSNAISIDLAMFGVAAPFFSVGNSGSQCNIDTGTLTLNTVFKIVGAYKADSFAAALNGGTPGTDNAGTIPTVSQMGIGNRLSGPYMNGHARKFAYWPQRLINAEVQAFSK